MSPRLKINRKVSDPPKVKGFHPFGLNPDIENNKEKIVINYEEYEALRLCDYEMLNHHQASVIMQVSRPTFTRIYSSALQKIAKAFVEGKSIIFEGGKVYFDSDWYHCNNCDCFFNNPYKEESINTCPLCKNNNIEKIEQQLIEEYEANTNTCRNCGHHWRKNRNRKNASKCPKCNK